MKIVCNAPAKYTLYTMIYIVMISLSIGGDGKYPPPPNLNPKEACLIIIALFSITHNPPTSHHEHCRKSVTENYAV